MALSPSPDNSQGEIALWVPDARADEAAALVAGLGFAVIAPGDGVTVARSTPPRAPARRAAPADRQVDLPPRGDPRRDGGRARARPRLPRRGRHELHAAGRPAPRRARAGRRRRGRSSAARACATPPCPTGRSTSATPARSCACCPAGWPPRRAAPTPSTATPRSAAGPVDRIAEPLRLMGARDRRHRRAPAALHRHRRAPALDPLRAAGGQRAGEVVRRCSPAWPPTAPPRSPSRRPAATTPSACWPPPG